MGRCPAGAVDQSQTRQAPSVQADRSLSATDRELAAVSYIASRASTCCSRGNLTP